jgi:hypothetical protein
MKRLTVLLFIFALGAVLIKIAPVFVFGFTVIKGTGLCPNDFLDILAWVPFLVVIFFFIGRELTRDKDILSPGLLFLIFLFGAIFFEGHGIHFGANAIHNAQAGESISDGLSALTYFYDEHLGHWVMDTGFYGILLLLLSLELKGKGQKDAAGIKEIALILFASLLFGFYAGSAALESQTAKIVLLYFISLIIIVPLAARFIKSGIRRFRFGLFLVGSGVVILIAYAIYYAVFGGLIEPSQWM